MLLVESDLINNAGLSAVYGVYARLAQVLLYEHDALERWECIASVVFINMNQYHIHKVLAF